MILNSNLDNYVVVKNLKPKSDATINVNIDIPIEFDGYICERINYSAQTGYSIIYIKNENKEVIFTHQMNCGTNVGYAHDGCFVPVKKGWYFRVEGQSIQAAQYKFTHII